MQTATFTIQGMHCAGCQRTIEHILRQQQGVWETEVSLDHASARVLFDPQQISSQQLSQAVENAGYRVTSA